MLRVLLEVSLCPMIPVYVVNVVALLIRRFALLSKPTTIVSFGRIAVMSMGLPWPSVISVLIVVPGFCGSSMPTMKSACVFWVGARRSVVRRVAVVSDFKCLGLNIFVSFLRFGVFWVGFFVGCGWFDLA